MNTKIASVIERETGINVKEKSIALSSDNIRHIFNNHGEQQDEASRGQIEIDIHNIENIIEAIIDPDTVKKEVNKDQSISLLFEKVLLGRNLAVTILSNKKNTLTLQSARIYRKGISSPSDARTSLSTSKTMGSMNPSSATIIRENSKKSTENVKKSSKISSERFSIDVEQSEKQKRDANYVTSLLKLSLTIKTCAKTLISALSGSSSLKYVNILASSSPEIIQNFSSLRATQFCAREFYPEYNSEYS